MAKLLSDDEAAQERYDGDETIEEVDETSQEDDPKRLRARIRGVEGAVERKSKAIERKESEIAQQQIRVQQEQAVLDARVLELQTIKEQLQHLRTVAADLTNRQAALAAKRAQDGLDPPAPEAASEGVVASGSVPQALFAAASMLRSSCSENPQVVASLEVLLQHMGSIYNVALQGVSPPPLDPKQPTIPQFLQRQSNASPPPPSSAAASSAHSPAVVATSTSPIGPLSASAPSPPPHATPAPLPSGPAHFSISTPAPSRDQLFATASAPVEEHCVAGQVDKEVERRLSSNDMWDDCAQQGIKRSIEEPARAEQNDCIAVDSRSAQPVAESSDSRPLDQSESRHGFGPIPPMRRDAALRRLVEGSSKTLDPVPAPARGRSSPY